MMSHNDSHIIKAASQCHEVSSSTICCNLGQREFWSDSGTGNYKTDIVIRLLFDYSNHHNSIVNLLFKPATYTLVEIISRPPQSAGTERVYPRHTVKNHNLAGTFQRISP